MTGGSVLAVLSTGPKAAIAAAVGLSIFAIARSRLSLAAVLTIAALAAGSSSVTPIKDTFLTARWGALFGLLAALLLATPLRRPDRLDQILAALVAVAFISAAWSVDPRLTLERAVSFAALLLVVRLLAEVQSSSAGSKHDLLDAFATLPILAIAASLIVLAVQPNQAVRLNEFEGFFENPNGLGLFVGLTFPFLLGAFDRRHASNRRIVLVVLAAAAVPLVSSSRSGLLTLLVGVLAYEASRREWQRLALEVAAILAATLVAFVLISSFPSLSGVATNGTFVVHRSPNLSLIAAITGGRNEAWGATIRLIDRRPLLGYGFGTGDQIFARYPRVAHFREFQGALPENAYLQLVLELGIVGGLAYLAFLVGAARAAVRMIHRRAQDPAEAAFAAVLLAALVAVSVESVLEAAGAPWSMLAWLAAIVVLRTHSSVPQSSEEPALAGTSTSLEQDRSKSSHAIAVRGWLRRYGPVLPVAGVAVITAAGIGYGLGDRAKKHSNASDRMKALARVVVAETCRQTPCSLASLSEVAPGLWRIVATGPERNCLLVDATRLRLGGKRPFAGVAYLSCTPFALVRRDVMTVATSFSNADLSGKETPAVGFQADVLRAIATQLGLNGVRFLDLPAADAFGVRPKADLISGPKETPASLAIGRPSMPYFYGHAALLQLTQRPGGRVTTLVKAKRMRLVAYGPGIKKFLVGKLHMQHVLTARTPEEAIADVTAHRADGAVVDWTLAFSLASSSGNTVEVAGLLPLDPYVYPFFFPYDSALRSNVDNAILNLVHQGVFSHLQQKWFPKLGTVRQLT